MQSDTDNIYDYYLIRSIVVNNRPCLIIISPLVGKESRWPVIAGLVYRMG